MTRDIILFNTKQKIQSIEMIDESQLEPTDFDSAIEIYFDYVIEKKSHIEIEGIDFTIIFIRDSDLVKNKLLNIRGENALFELIILAKENGWQIYDSIKQQIINLENPSENGYKNFQNYLQFLEDEKNIPDFSVDDLGDDKEIQKSRLAAEKHKNFIEEIISKIQSEFSAIETEEYEIAEFHMTTDLNSFVVRVLKWDYEGLNIQILMTMDEYFFGNIKLKEKYPKTYIQKETLSSRLSDFISNRDIDFTHSKKFSGKFQVVSTEPDKLESLMLFKNLDALVEFPEMELEFNGNECLFRSSRKSVSVKEAEIFSDLTKTLISIFK